AAGVVRIYHEKKPLGSHPRGQNPTHNLRHIFFYPRVAPLFLLPRRGATPPVNGPAPHSPPQETCARLAGNEKAPRAVLVVSVDRIFYQCSKAIVRSKLWDPSRHVDRKSLPSNGTILAELTDGRLGGEAHDRAAPERLKATLY